MDFFDAAEVPDDRVRADVEHERAVVENDAHDESRVGKPIQREVLSKVADEGRVQVAMQGRHQPSHHHDRDAEGRGRTLGASNQVRKDEAAVPIVHHPNEQEEQRHDFESVPPLEVEEHEAEHRGELHQEPAETRAEVEAPLVRREAPVRALHHGAADEHHEHEDERERQHRVVGRIPGVPGHHRDART